MGYTSDVALVLRRRAARDLRAKIAGLDEGLAREVNELFDAAEHRVSSTGGEECWLWEGIRWSMEFPDVDFVENFMLRLRGGDYRFVRIGDDYSDIEDCGSFWDSPYDVGVSRKISFRSHAGSGDVRGSVRVTFTAPAA